jgi:hypothetical protein
MAPGFEAVSASRRAIFEGAVLFAGVAHHADGCPIYINSPIMEQALLGN